MLIVTNWNYFFQFTHLILLNSVHRNINDVYGLCNTVIHILILFCVYCNSEFTLIFFDHMLILFRLRFTVNLSLIFI